MKCGRVGGKPGVGRNCSRSLSWCSANEKSEGKVSYLKKANRGKDEESRGRRTAFLPPPCFLNKRIMRRGVQFSSRRWMQSWGNLPVFPLGSLTGSLTSEPERSRYRYSRVLQPIRKVSHLKKANRGKDGESRGRRTAFLPPPCFLNKRIMRRGVQFSSCRWMQSWVSVFQGTTTNQEG